MRPFPILMCFFLATPPASAQISDTDRSLLKQLMQNNEFADRIPAGHRISSFERTGGVVPGPLIWGPNPNELSIIPKAVASVRHVNCEPNRTRTYGGTMGISYNERYSFTTTRGSEIAQTFSISAPWPTATLGYEVSAKISASTDETEESGETVSFSPDYEALTSPLAYIDAQMQVMEQEVEGQPFAVDVEITGDAAIGHVPEETWLPRKQAAQAVKVIAGSEVSPTSGVKRDLAICRARHGATQHPGKIVAGKCNYGFGGEEHEARRYSVLSMPSGSYKWMYRRKFEEKHDDETVADGGSPAVIAGKEDRDDRYEGQLVVCRAKHRGNYHPGKIVINHCMIGYGGDEKQKRTYQVLVRKDMKEQKFTVALADYLSREDRSFRVEGKFEGAKALNARIVTSRERPVDEQMCPGSSQPPPQAAEPQPPRGDVAVVRSPITPPAKPLNAANGTGAGGPAPKPTVPVTPTEDLIDGNVIASLSLIDGEQVLDYNIRTLRQRRPLMAGQDVLAVQQALINAGWPLLRDGVYGPNTARAVRHFQRTHRLRPDGIVGPRTEARLGL